MCSVEDLSLVFSLPGHDDVHLVPDGDTVDVTIDNIEDYTRLVLKHTLVTGVRLQMEVSCAALDALSSVPSPRRSMKFARACACALFRCPLTASRPSVHRPCFVVSTRSSRWTACTFSPMPKLLVSHAVCSGHHGRRASCVI